MQNEKRGLSLVVAMDEERVIGREGGLPWRLPNDLKQFKQRTLGNTVLMGRKTWESLPIKPLPGRDNRVLTRDARYRAEGAQVFTDLQAALAAPALGEVIVIGGAELYALALPRAQRIYLTRVHARVGGDAWFPALDEKDWRETARETHAPDERHAHAYDFVTLERR